MAKYIVTGITDKTVTTKFGPKKVYNILVDDEDGSGHTHNYGFKKPPFKVGDTLSYEVSETTYGANVEVNTVRVISSGTGPAITGATSSSTPFSAPVPKAPYMTRERPFPIPPLHGDRAIIRQNALTNARELIVGIIGPVSSDEAVGHGRWEDTVAQMDKLSEEIIRVARKFEAYSAGDIEMAVAMESK